MKTAPYAQTLPGAFEREEEEIESSQALHYRQELTSQHGSRSHLWKSFDNEARHYARVEIRVLFVCLFGDQRLAGGNSKHPCQRLCFQTLQPATENCPPSVFTLGTNVC